jgi:hypothetical protein
MPTKAIGSDWDQQAEAARETSAPASLPPTGMEILSLILVCGAISGQDDKQGRLPMKTGCAPHRLLVLVLPWPMARQNEIGEHRDDEKSGAWHWISP